MNEKLTMISANLPNSFFTGWIILMVVIGFIFLFFILISSHFAKNPSHKKVVWDGDLSEGDEMLPRAWFWSFFASVIFSLIYIILFPGLGSYPGLLKWTSGGHHQAVKTDLDAEVSSRRNEWLALSPEELANNQSAMASAQSLFNTNCAGCHATDAAGLKGYYPNLRDSEWVWGSNAEDIYTSIKEGRIGIMPGWSAVINEEQAQSLAVYIASLSEQGINTLDPNHATYSLFCGACHGPTAEGNPLLGAPNLTNASWLYSNDVDSIKDVIQNGIGPSIMPAQKKRLSEAEIRLLVAWLLSKQQSTH